MLEEKKAEKMDQKKAAASKQTNKQSSQKVAASEYSHFIESLINLSSDMLYIYDIVERRNIYSNDGIQTVLGYTHEEIRKMGSGFMSSLMHPDDMTAYVTGVLPRYATARDGEHITHEYRMQHKSGAWHWIQSNEIIYKRDPHGVPLQVFGVGRKITEHKRVEEERLESEARFRELFETSRDGIAITDLSGRYLVCNHALLELLGYDSIDQLQQKSYEELTPREYHAFEAEFMANQTMTRGWSDEYEKEYTRKTGERVPVSLRVWLRKNAKGQPSGMWLLIRDITERKRTEESLRIKEERYRNLFEQSPVSLWEENVTELTEYFATLRSSGIADLRAYFVKYPDELMKCAGMVRIIAVNRATLELFDSPDEAALLQGLSQIFTTESFGAFREIVVSLFEGVESYACEAVNRTISGQKIDTLLRWSLLPKCATQGSRALISIIDITDRKRSEEALRKSEQFIRNILDTVDEGFIVVDRDYRILTANKAYCSQAGACSENIIGKHCYEVSHKTGRPCYEEGEECASRHAFETGTPHTALHHHKDANGNILYVETKAFPIKDASGAVTSVIEVINNITEKYLLEEERLKTQKLESIGTLAGGIAHDFNNLLQGVFGYISMAKLTHDQKEKSLAMLEQAEKALQMSVNLTTQLLTFSRGGTPVKKLIRLESMIENAVKFALSGSHTDHRLDIISELWPVEADEGQLAQAMQNIVRNANEAMAGRGKVNVSANNMDISPKANPRLPKGGRFVRIDIQDTGTGIPEQNMSKIFDPYFTSKQKGSGLGLATSYSIIKNHGGLIEVKSEVNRGTTFSIYLPAIKGAEVEPAVITSGVVSARTGKVLLMDDEDIVRRVAREMLKLLGHEVEYAENGERAIELFCQARDAGRPFDLVILDLTVRGGMGGEEAIANIRDIDPNVKVVVSSGYADNPVVAAYRAYGFSGVLNKPYKLDELKNCLNLFIS